MSSTSSLRGQIEAPNPVELFWEKHRRWVIAALVVVAAALAIQYGIEYANRRAANALWSDVAAATNLDRGYAESGSMAWVLQQPGVFGDSFDGRELYLSSARAELVTALGEDVASADSEALAAALQKEKGSAAEPILLWIDAARAVREQDWDKALAALTELQSRFPDHFLCAETPYPPQARAPKKDKDGDKDNAEKAKPEPSSPAGEETPALVPPDPGSPVSRLMQVVKEQQRFRADNPHLYEPPSPDPQPTVVVKLSNDQEFRIRFYREQAPVHVEAFLDRVRSGFYVGQTIDQVQRQGAGAAPRTSVEQMHFGLEASKSEDRSTWTDARTQPSSTVLEFEDNDLSHFPGMVAAAPEAGGKSSGERVWITASDAAAEFDGRRVIFGRVVEGMDVVEYICREASFLTEEMRNSGQGQLQLNLRIQAMEILDDAGKPAGGAGAVTEQPPGEGAAPSGSAQGEKR